MIMKDNGVIRGFVGVIGSGKSYAMSEMELRTVLSGDKFIAGDFSDGLRDGLMRILADKEGSDIDVNSLEYRAWKEVTETISVPLYDLNRASGRDLLTRFGTYMKEICGQDIWATWTYKDIITKLLAIKDMDVRNRSSIGIGSIRYECEAEILFNLSDLVDKKVIITFMDFHSEKYNPTFEHESEFFAQKLLAHGCKHMDDVTELIRSIVNGEKTL